MKTILVYSLSNGVGYGSKLREIMIENLRLQGVRYERNQDYSIIIGQTKVLFYSARQHRNDKVFVKKHKKIDAIFLDNAINLFDDVVTENPQEQNLVFDTFLKNQEVIQFGRGVEKAYTQLAEQIDEIQKELNFAFSPKLEEISKMLIPVGISIPSIHHYPLSYKDDIKELIDSNIKHTNKKIKELEDKIELEKARILKLEQNKLDL